MAKKRSPKKKPTEPTSDAPHGTTGGGTTDIPSSDTVVEEHEVPKTGYEHLDRRRMDVARMYLEGHSLYTMADKHGVAHTTIKNDLKHIRQAWLQRMAEAFDAKKAEELAKIDHVEDQAWVGWYSSLRDDVVRSRRTETMPAKEEEGEVETPRSKRGYINASEYGVAARKVVLKTVEVFEKRGQSGNPRFLEVVMSCVEMRMKALGMLKESSATASASIGINWEGLLMGVSQARHAPDPIEAAILAIEHVPSTPHNGSTNNGNGTHHEPHNSTEPTNGHYDSSSQKSNGDGH